MPKSKRPASLRCISRIDIPLTRTHGWEVRVTRRGVAHAKFFADKSNGGKRKALEAAKVHRDQLVATHPGYTMQERARKIRTTNKSGITGVCSRTVKVKRGKTVHEYPAWVATHTKPKGKRVTKTFYIHKHGEKKAKQLAIKQRREWEAQSA